MWTSSGLVLVPGGTDAERVRGHFLEAVTVEKVFRLVPSSTEVIARVPAASLPEDGHVLSAAGTEALGWMHEG